MTINLNLPAPDFSLPDEKGKYHKLSDFKGKPIVLYFYQGMIRRVAQKKLVIFGMTIMPIKLQVWKSLE